MPPLVRQAKRDPMPTPCVRRDADVHQQKPEASPAFLAPVALPEVREQEPPLPRSACSDDFFKLAAQIWYPRNLRHPFPFAPHPVFACKPRPSHVKVRFCSSVRCLRG